jgi:hypothetical protein
MGRWGSNRESRRHERDKEGKNEGKGERKLAKNAINRKKRNAGERKVGEAAFMQTNYDIVT